MALPIRKDEHDEQSRYIEQTQERVRSCIADGMTQSEVARIVGFSATRLSQFLSGKYAGDMLETAKAVNYGLDKHLQQTSAPREPEFAHTTAARQVEEVCSYAHRMQTMGMVHGDAGLGKSMALSKYAGEHRDAVLLTVNPTMRSAKAVLEELAEVLGLKETGTERRIHKAIVRTLKGSGRLVIIDEAQHLSLRALDTLRCICDEAKVGFVFCGNDELHGQLSGRSRSEFAQFFSRIGIRRHLDPTVAPEDVERVFAGHDLGKDALERLFQIANDGKGLRGCVKTYLLAANFAARAGGRKVTAALIQEAYRFLEA